MIYVRGGHGCVMLLKVSPLLKAKDTVSQKVVLVACWVRHLREEKSPDMAEGPLPSPSWWKSFWFSLFHLLAEDGYVS